MSAEVDIKQLVIVRDEAAPSPKRRRHVLSRYLVPGILLFGFLGLIAWASRDAIRPPQQVWVVPVLATQSATHSEGTPLFQAAGWIEPRPTPVRVAALAPGVVERLLVVEDQAVKAGEPIAELVREDAKLAHDRAAAELKLREAEVAEMNAGLAAAITRLEKPLSLQAGLGEAEAVLAEVTRELKNLPFETRRAEAQLEFARGNYERKRSAGNAVSGRDVSEAKSTRDAAEAMVEELRIRAESLTTQQVALSVRRDALAAQLALLTDEKQGKEVYEAKLRAATARADKARVALAEAELRLERMTVRAPIDGRVYQLVAYPGTTLTGGMGPIPNADGSTVVTMYRPEMLQVRVDVRFEDIPKVSLGQPVLIKNPALKEPISGKVLFVSSEANIQKNTLEVKVALDSPPAVLKPDMLVEVTHLAPQMSQAVAATTDEMRLYAPQHLVLHDDGGAYVWLADQSAGVARKTTVTTAGAAAGGLVEISSGLTMASRLIGRGQEGLSDGKRIQIADEDASAARVAGLSEAGPSAQQPLQRFPHERE
jgi:multidrug efflux pump subunit AcrA (membrane-fusion protein)